ncbi:LysR substrate-binding domain-containing protein [Legionella jamestowniensis]|uniref:Transcriptional regulator n=1 Tax=Legionella jamestowniensis TaxID=455 RepID=A0A0W0ULS4_9GAMM|nr:LysR substrate-binding domain-containing protein [Legionella jamestowniensis]KTD08663.1 transcriptional regulator [Legionella jamestowniensis]OCH96893.1 DNA-binding transcriptional regulator OxyR [Legionella jamestowniensis]SFL54523.1 LysR family transcriptional regulator, hydrogen peroxide-inducible genes activator [Legionella jamestowniensis DSM 19215]
MNLRDLQYFVVLAEVMHFGEAAKKCHISQPTLSMQIKKLEDELGILLFERNNKQVMLTEGGRSVLERAQQILTEVSEMKEIARQASDPFAGELHVGVIPTLAPYLLPHVMPAIQSTFPKLKVWLVEEKTHHLIDKLASGQLDAALMATPISEEFASQILFEEPFYFASTNKGKHQSKKEMQLGDLVHQPVMLLEEGHCLREQAIAVCQLVKAEGRADFTATSLETLRFMVEAGLGVTLLPALAVQENKRGLQLTPFAKPAPSRTIALYWRRGTAKLLCLQAIGEIITCRVNELLKEKHS